jgi:hypothetical protein
VTFPLAARAAKFGPGVKDIIVGLLGCSWGREVHTEDDPDECQAQAVQIVVVHGPLSDAVRELRLCAKHLDRINDETTPRET